MSLGQSKDWPGVLISKIHFMGPLQFFIFQAGM
jgi:hypothetical protein